MGGDFTNAVNAGESIELEEKPVYTLFIHHRDVPGVFVISIRFLRITTSTYVQIIPGKSAKAATPFQSTSSTKRYRKDIGSPQKNAQERLRREGITGGHFFTGLRNGIILLGCVSFEDFLEA